MLTALEEAELKEIIAWYYQVVENTKNIDDFQSLTTELSGSESLIIRIGGETKRISSQKIFNKFDETLQVERNRITANELAIQNLDTAETAKYFPTRADATAYWEAQNTAGNPPAETFKIEIGALKEYHVFDASVTPERTTFIKDVLRKTSDLEDKTGAVAEMSAIAPILSENLINPLSSFSTQSNSNIKENGNITDVNAFWRTYVFDVEGKDSVDIFTKTVQTDTCRLYAFYTAAPIKNDNSGSNAYIEDSGDTYEGVAREIDLKNTSIPENAKYLAVSIDVALASSLSVIGNTIKRVTSTGKHFVKADEIHKHSEEKLKEAKDYLDEKLNPIIVETVTSTSTFFNAVIEESGRVYDLNGAWRTYLFHVENYDTVSFFTKTIQTDDCRMYAFYTNIINKNDNTGIDAYIENSGDTYEGVAREIDLEDFPVPDNAKYMAITIDTASVGLLSVVGKAVKRVIENGNFLVHSGEIKTAILEQSKKTIDDILLVSNKLEVELDSLVAGAANSNWIKYIKDRWLGQFQNTELGYQAFNNDVAVDLNTDWGASPGWAEMVNQSDYSIPPMCYSPNLKGLFQINCSGDYIDWTPDREWDFADIYYLQQPTGGTFAVRNAIGTNTLIDSEGDFENKKVTISRQAGQTNRFNVNGCNGNIALFGVRFRNKGNQNASIVNYATGGMRLESFNKIKPETVQYFSSEEKWKDVINISGMNDRAVSDGPTYKAMLKSRIENILIGSPHTRIHLISPNQSDDYGTTNLPAYETARQELSEEFENVFHHSVPYNFGDYASLSSNGYMADGIHPNDALNNLIDDFQLYILGVDIHKDNVYQNKVITQSTYSLKGFDHHFNLIFTNNNCVVTVPSNLKEGVGFKGYFKGENSLSFVGASGVTVVGATNKTNQYDSFEIAQIGNLEYLVK